MIASKTLKKTVFPPILECLLFGTILTVFLIGCATTIKVIDPHAAQIEKEDSLISFKEYLGAQNYRAAVHRLAPEDQMKILDAKGHVPDAMRARLRGLRMKNLVHDPAVKLVNGKLTGIYAALPVENLGNPMQYDSTLEMEEMKPKAPSQANIERQKVDSAAQVFFSDIRSGDWSKVLDDIYPSTRAVFVSENGRIKASARHRLAAIDTSAWNDLTLRNAKLIGVTLIIPPPQPELEKAATAFFDSIASQDWNAALNMLVENERKTLTGPDGNIKPEYKEKLSKLNPDEWDALFWYDQKLSGVLDLLGIAATPLAP